MIALSVVGSLFAACGGSQSTTRTYLGERCISNPSGEHACEARGSGFRYGPVDVPHCSGIEIFEPVLEQGRIERSRQACSCNDLAAEKQHRIDCDHMK